MESHIVASVAQKHAIPMAAIRVITDPAGRALPKSALAAMRPDGTTDFPAMMHHLFKNPWELPRILRTALDARAARATLMRGRQLLGPRLGLPDFQRLELDVVA
jgi:pyruvate/oxaloacetate carboxyltransferase